VKRLALRLLAERDRDRDPGPLLATFAEQTLKEEVKTAFQKFTYDLVDMPLIASSEYGYSRLRKLQPVAVYADLLSQDRKVNLRLNVVLGLGDTGELEALGPLVYGLTDPHRAVRVAAADSVRRLRHAGAGEILAGHPIREPLVAALGDRRKAVRVAAARALVSLNDSEPVRKALRNTL
jgi:HEAT repeat protein